MKKINIKKLSSIKITTVIIIILLFATNSASAITVDGVKSPNEWNEDWAFNQYEASTYDPNGPFGDRLVIQQGDFWYDEDPKNDSGIGHDQSMALLGSSSGLDIKRLYSHYDFSRDTMYVMISVYGIPGDLDGNGDIGTIYPPSPGGDYLGDSGPAGIGIGIYEIINLNFIQVEDSMIKISNNDWTTYGIPYDQVKVAYTDDPDIGCYEISIEDFSMFVDFSLGADYYQMFVYSGGIIDDLGEDSAKAHIYPTTLQTVQIDIKPGSDPNSFNNNGNGVIPVAILGSMDFDVMNIDPGTVELEGVGVRVVGKSNKLLAHNEDVNGDSHKDLVVQIEVSDHIFLGGCTMTTVSGKLIDGTPFEGQYTICIVPKKSWGG